MVAVVATLVELVTLGVCGFLCYLIALSAHWYYYVAAVAVVLILVLATRPFKKSAENAVGKKTMKAGIYNFSAPSGFSVVENYPIPKYGPKDVIVRVIAAAINPVDYKIVPLTMPFVRHFAARITGRDIAGVVIAVGSRVSNLQIGDHIYGNAYGGALAEFTVAHCNSLGRSPKNMSWQEVAGIPVTGLTGYQVFKKNGLKSGDRIMIIGASGGCGLVGVQIAKAMGAHVIGVCSTSNIDLVKSVGADETLDYTEPDFKSKIEPRSLDFIYDVVSSPTDPDQEPWARPFLKQDATSPYSKINAGNGDWVRVFLSKAFGINFQRKDFDLHLMQASSEDLNNLAELIETAKITIKIDSEMLLDNAGIRQAYDRQKSRRAKGKIIFNITPDYTPLEQDE